MLILKTKHHPKCLFEADCSICRPTHLEQLVQKYGAVSIAQGLSAPFVIELAGEWNKELKGKREVGETIELAALKLLKDLET